jgi:hypothetical protein
VTGLGFKRRRPARASRLSRSRFAPRAACDVSRPSQAISIAALALVVLGTFGCGGGTITANNNVTSITISPTSATLSPNASQDFSAQVVLANSQITTNTNVTWQVNGTNGGNATTGTIVASSVDANVGVYTAPAVVPSTNINITAVIVENSSSSSTSTTTITSNVATVGFGGVAGLSIMPGQATVGAGGSQQFEAMLNDAVDSNATYTISPSTPNYGSINATSGVYTAPTVPPPGGMVTVTAKDGTQTATATATIVFSDASLLGPFAFSYAGNNSAGFFAVAGRFSSNGQGAITGGVEDINSFGTHVASATQIQQNSTYKVGPDGRSTAIIQTDQGTETLQFVLTSSSHALLIRFDGNMTGSGTIDQQNLNDLSSASVISGPYAFLAAGGDSTFNPMAVAGRFSADGSGNAQQPAILDENDNFAPKTSDTSLSGTYQLDANNPGTGRGTLTLSSTNVGQLQFAFYIIDNTHLHIVEIDAVNYLAGDVYLEPPGPSYTTSSLAAANYAFTGGGNSSAGAYALGGIFTPDGNGNITGGVLDTNNAGTPTANTTLSASTYAVDPTTGRLSLALGSMTLAAYPTAANTVVMLEVDSTAVSSGLAYQQQGSPAALAGNFGLTLGGQGVFYNAPASYQPDIEGQAVLKNSSAVSAGNLDINVFGTTPQPSDPLATTSSFGTLGSNGRGTATLTATDPPASFSLVYYWVNANTALIVGQDKTRVVVGTMLLQF